MDKSSKSKVFGASRNRGVDLLIPGTPQEKTTDGYVAEFILLSVNKVMNKIHFKRNYLPISFRITFFFKTNIFIKFFLS